MATSPASNRAASGNLAGKTGKYGDLKRRLIFLLGALVVYRVGAHIPVPGIDPTELTKLFQSQQGGILGMFNMFSGGALSRFTIFALGIMPYISRVDHHAAADGRVAAAGSDQEGRRVGPSQDHAVHALRHAAARHVPGARHRGRARVAAGPRARSGLHVPHHDGDLPDDRHDVPDVARRADHRARPRQRHLDHHLRRHRGGPAARARQPVRARQHRRDEHPDA